MQATTASPSLRKDECFGLSWFSYDPVSLRHLRAFAAIIDMHIRLQRALTVGRVVTGSVWGTARFVRSHGGGID